MHRHECAFIMQIKGLSRILICMPVEMPISQTPFLFYLNIYSSPSQHSHAYSHRKRGQDGSGWLRRPCRQPMSWLMLALPVSYFSGSAFILRIRVLIRGHQPAPLGTLKTDGGSEILFWNCEWAQTHVWEEGTIVVTHAAKSMDCPASLTLSFTMRHFAGGGDRQWKQS